MRTPYQDIVVVIVRPSAVSNDTLQQPRRCEMLPVRLQVPATDFPGIMRRSRIAIVTFIAASLVAVVIAIVRYGQLAQATSANATPDAVVASPSAAATGRPTSTPAVAPSASTSPVGSVSPSATATAAPAPAPSTSASRRSVDVLITYLDWSAGDGVVEAGAYATVVEQPGTCTLKLTSAERSTTASVTSLIDASTMSCGGLTVPRDRLSTGRWTALVTYESATSTGTSAPVEVVVP